MDVKQAMRFKWFVFFQSGADTYAFDKDQLKVAYCNEDGIGNISPDPQIVTHEWTPVTGGNTCNVPLPGVPGRLECTGDVPWLSIRGVKTPSTDIGAWANRGIIFWQAGYAPYNVKLDSVGDVTKTREFLFTARAIRTL
jgi:hypothetical protein